MSTRAQPDIRNVIVRLTEMHERHAVEQAGQLVRMRDAGKDDSSLQGTVNKAVVILRDWLSNLDRDALPAVRDGEESLRKEYDKALRDKDVSGNAALVDLLKTQMGSIDSKIARLPRS